jgi:hypothetical protein
MDFLEVLRAIFARRRVSIIIIFLLTLSLSFERENFYRSVGALLVSIVLARLFGDPAEERIVWAEKGEDRVLSKIRLTIDRSLKAPSIPSPEVRASVLAQFSSLFCATFSPNDGYRSHVDSWDETINCRSRCGIGTGVHAKASWSTIERRISVPSCHPKALIYGLQPGQVVHDEASQVWLSIELKRRCFLWPMLINSSALFLIILNLRLDESLEFAECAIAALIVALVFWGILHSLEKAASKAFHEARLLALVENLEMIFERLVLRTP